jgi:hypothetical protein
MSHRPGRAPRASRLSLAVRHALATSVFMAIATAAGAAAPDEGVIRLNARLLDPVSKDADALRGALPKSNGKQLHLVQYEGPIQRRWYEALEATGAQIVDFIPDNTYLVYGDQQALSRIRDAGRSPDSGVRWVRPIRRRAQDQLARLRIGEQGCPAGFLRDPAGERPGDERRDPCADPRRRLR